MEVLPQLSLISSPDGRDAQLELLKLLAELAVFCGSIEKPEDKVQQLYSALIVSVIIFRLFVFSHSCFFMRTKKILKILVRTFKMAQTLVNVRTMYNG